MSDKKISFSSLEKTYEDHLLKVFRIHPNGMRIIKAEKTLQGRANKDALTWCGPYGEANALGWWVFPAVDAQIICHGDGDEGYKGRWGGSYTYKIEQMDDSDFDTMQNFEKSVSNDFGISYGGKTKYAIDEPEKFCFSLWTGCVFQMPKDWCLLVRSPINTGIIYDQGMPVNVQEGILEVDWMRYDIWINFKFHTFNKPFIMKKDQDQPIAQLIPIHRSSFESNWGISDVVMNPENEDCLNMYPRYSEYNYLKWVRTGEKDPFTFRKLKKSVKQNMS